MLETRESKLQRKLQPIGVVLGILVLGVMFQQYTGINFFFVVIPLALFGLYKHWAWAKALFAILGLLLAVVAIAAMCFNVWPLVTEGPSYIEEDVAAETHVPTMFDPVLFSCSFALFMIAGVTPIYLVFRAGTRQRSNQAFLFAVVGWFLLVVFSLFESRLVVGLPPGLLLPAMLVLICAIVLAPIAYFAAYRFGSRKANTDYGDDGGRTDGDDYGGVDDGNGGNQ